MAYDQSLADAQAEIATLRQELDDTKADLSRMVDLEAEARARVGQLASNLTAIRAAVRRLLQLYDLDNHNATIAEIPKLRVFLDGGK